MIAWQRRAAGYYIGVGNSTGIYEITQVRLDDGLWWIVEYPDHTTGDPAPTLAQAKRWAEAAEAE